MKKYENGKVEMIGLTDKHVQILYQTLADILAEKIAPDIKVIVKTKRKNN